MKIVVLIKQVPDTETKVKLLADSSQVDLSTAKWVVNPYDEFAIEEAVQFKEKNPSASIFAVTLGPKKRVGDALRTALAMGADEGVLIDAPENLEPEQVAQILADYLRSEPDVQLVLAGKLAIDDQVGGVPQMVAEKLGWSHASVVSKITLTPPAVVVERDLDGGAKEVVHLNLPCVLSANKGLNMPRYASLPGIMKAKKKTLREIAAQVTAPVVVKKVVYSLPAEKQPAQLINGDVSSQVKTLIEKLRNEAKVL